VEVDVLAYSQTQLSGIVSRIAGDILLEGGRIDLEVVSGGGTVAGLVTVIDNANDDATAWLSRIRQTPSTSSATTSSARETLSVTADTIGLVVPSIVSGYATFPGMGLPYTFQTSLTFSSGTASPATFDVKFKDLVSGQEHVKRVDVPGRKTVEYADVVTGLFGLPAGTLAQGPVSITATLNGSVQCRVFSILADGTLGESFPVVAVPSESLTSAADGRPLFVDGLGSRSTARAAPARTSSWPRSPASPPRWWCGSTRPPTGRTRSAR
jgi:hypothetical protein